jgi:hypothetical protein
MKDSIEIIQIEWDGPFTFSEITRFTSETDYGVYQIYGGHPLYGSNALVYIGKARDQCFWVRIPQEKYWQDNRDANRLNVYLGRLAGAHTPTDDVWGRQIDLAERLLIFAHSPANNTQKNINRIDADLQNIHVLNWGYHRNLLPEVSGARWTSKLGLVPGYKEYDANDPGR